MKSALLPFLAFVVLPVLPAAEPEPSNPWQMLATYRFADAEKAFQQTTGRDALLGRALSLLNRPPVSAASQDEARELLASLVADGATDEPALAAHYLLARIRHVHQSAPDLALAAKHYRDLITLAPDHPLAQQSVARLALLVLYDPAQKDRIEASLAEMEALAARLTLPEARRDVHAVLADIYVRRIKRPADALRHLEAQLATGAVRLVRMRNNLCLQIAETARELGQRELAVARYRQFLDGTLRDTRRQWVRERLAALLEDKTG